MAQKELSPEKVEEYRQAFNLFDKDGNGNITIDELETVLRSFGQTPTSEELSSMMREVDSDDFTEFLSMMASKITSQEDEIAECFQVFDRNNSGSIESDELKEVMESLGETLTQEEIEFMIRELDESNRGFVVFEEFKKMAEGKKL